MTPIYRIVDRNTLKPAPGYGYFTDRIRAEMTLCRMVDRADYIVVKKKK